MLGGDGVCLCCVCESIRTSVGINQGVRLPLNSPCCSRVLVNLLHRVEVNGVNSAECREADLVLAVLMSRLMQTEARGEGVNEYRLGSVFRTSSRIIPSDTHKQFTHANVCICTVLEDVVTAMQRATAIALLYSR